MVMMVMMLVVLVVMNGERLTSRKRETETGQPLPARHRPTQPSTLRPDLRRDT